ncbi:hypothetical protein ACFXMS_41690, partial [Streptomyces sp. NPDC059215]
MQRRMFIGGAAALAAAVTTACNAKGGPSTRASAAAQTSGAPVRATASATPAGVRAAANWTALAKDLDGILVRPGDRAWSTAHQLYNTRFDTLKPAAVAYAA